VRGPAVSVVDLEQKLTDVRGYSARGLQNRLRARESKPRWPAMATRVLICVIG
jgi:hypothetical protein